MSPLAHSELLVPSEVALELREALIKARRFRLGRLIERAPLSVLSFLKRDLVERVTRIPSDSSAFRPFRYSPCCFSTEAAAPLGIQSHKKED